ncbi:MAG: signal peptidase I [Clostridia bacterium]|nr:signal peptidase I [Clostridia bacterium]
MKRLIGAIACIALFMVLGMAIRTFGFSLVRISGTSMNDTLASGDVVLVTRFDYLSDRTPERMEIVECAFDMRSDTYVKRVVGLPGERIVYSDSMLNVNGQPVSEPYVKNYTEDFYVKLGADEYFVMGDNRSESYDSRAADMGPIRAEAFLGRVRWILWPLGRFGPVN